MATLDDIKGTQPLNEASTPTFASITTTDNFTVDGLSSPNILIDDIKDDDTMAGNSATALVTEQAIKAYVDSKGLEVQDETVQIDAATIRMNFAGNGVVVNQDGAGQVTVTVAGVVSGFSWVGTAITTNTALTVNNGYFVDTSISPPLTTLTLPGTAASPTLTIGDTIKIKDYAGTFDVANVLVQADGTDKIEGSESPNSYNITEKGSETTFVWSGTTRGWMITSVI